MHSAVTDRFGVIYLHPVLIVTCLDSSFLFLACLIVAWSTTATISYDLKEMALSMSLQGLSDSVTQLSVNTLELVNNLSSACEVLIMQLGLFCARPLMQVTHMCLWHKK